MCGIVGMFDMRGKRDINRDLLSRMNESQHHRGPDECGMHVEPGLGLGHRRLSIIDLSTGQQPLYNEDRSVVIVYNGEIYNYQSLIPELTALGHTFRTRSDTEVIVHAWEAWGASCVERLRGMFAFALWDRNRQTLFLARDRLGVKPLHYGFLSDGTVVFGSELKALLAHPGLQRDIDPCAVEEYFALGYVPEPRTIFRGALKLAPAHTLVLRRGEAPSTPVNYWDPRFSVDRAISVGDATRELVTRLDESVRLRMIAEVPLGAFLSGGVDSSAVVASMAAVSAEPGQHLLDFVRRPGVRRNPLCAADRRALSDAPSGRARRVRRLRLDRPPRAHVRRAVRRQLGHSHVPGLPARAESM
jgi:asparagine synthase (glutamine-hydrolysing)